MNPEIEELEFEEPDKEKGKSKDAYPPCPITGHKYRGSRFQTSGGIKEKHIRRHYNTY